MPYTLTGRPLGELVLPVATEDPSINGDGIFSYIDIASINREEKSIDTPSLINNREAPSRARQLVKYGDVLVSTVRPNLNAVAAVPIELDGAVASTGFTVLRPDQTRLNSRYLFNWVKSPAFVEKMTCLATGASYPAVSDRIVKNSTVPLPPLGEQRRIAEVLDKADALRQKRRLALRKLDTLLQSVFLEMFGDPVANPKGWKVLPLSQFVSEFQAGKSILAETTEHLEVKYRVLKVSAVTALEYRPEQSKPVPPNYAPEYEHFVRPGDLLFSRANTTELVGAVAYVWQTPNNLLLPDKLWRFVWKNENLVDPFFIRSVFTNESFRFELGKIATGTSGSMKNISQARLMSVKMPLPDFLLQKLFGEFVQRHHDLATKLSTAKTQMDVLFRSLQEKAFSGELFENSMPSVGFEPENAWQQTSR